MAIFTFIMEFRGGTYIKQVAAQNERQAVELWVKEINPNDITYFGEKSKTELQNNLSELLEFLTRIETVQNVWHLAYSLPTGYIDIHIIKTA